MVDTQQQQGIHYDDYTNTTVFFGEVKKSIFSKNFRGGNITNVFGVTQFDFTCSDINGPVVIDVTQAFGEVKVIVPADWHVQTDISKVFVVVKDKRTNPVQAIDGKKVLVLRGVSFFASVEILSAN